MHTEAWLGRHNDEGDWQFSPEWWGTQGGSWGRNAGDTVFESQSAIGNGVISVTSHPASTPVCFACPTFFSGLRWYPILRKFSSCKYSVEW